MKDEKVKKLPKIIVHAGIEEELEEKYFPKSHEKKILDKTMKDPELFEEQLKEKLRKCMIKK